MLCPCRIPAGSLQPQSHPCPTTPCPTALCPMALCSPKDPPALPSQNLCLPSLEASGSEAQVSKVEKQFLPLQIASVLFSDSSHTALEAGAAATGAAPRCCGGCPWHPGPPQRVRTPCELCPNLGMDGCGSQVPFPGSCLYPGVSKSKLVEHKAAAPARGWVHSMAIESRARVRVPGLWYPHGTQPQPRHGLSPGSGGILVYFGQKWVILIPCSPQESMPEVTAPETSPRPMQH